MKALVIEEISYGLQGLRRLVSRLRLKVNILKPYRKTNSIIGVKTRSLRRSSQSFYPLHPRDYPHPIYNAKNIYLPTPPPKKGRTHDQFYRGF